MSSLKTWLAAHRTIIMSAVGVSLVPLLYAASLIGVNHDPAGKLHNVPALVVDLDSPAKTSTGEKIDLGPTITKSLVDNDDANNLDWKEASEDEAKAELADGRALAVITIPKGFSAAVASAGDDDPMKARSTQLQVQTNDASNYLMSSISYTIGTKVTNSVREQVSDAYLKNVYVGFTDLHGKMSEAADGASQLADGATDAHSGAGSLVVGLSSLHDGTVQLDAGAVKLASGASTLSDGASTLADGLGTLKDKTAALPSQTKQLDSGAKALASGAGKVDTAAGKLADGASTLSNGASTLAKGTSALPDATKKLDSGAQQVAAGNRKLADTASGIDTQVRSVAGTTQTTLKSLGTLLEDATGISSSTRVDVSGTAKDAHQRLESLLADPQVKEALEQAGLSDQAATIQKDLDNVATGASQTQTAIEKAERSAGIVKKQQGTSIADLEAASTRITAAADQLASSTEKLADGSEQVAAGTHQLAGKAPALASGAKDLSDGAARLSKGTATLAGSTPQLASGAQQLADGTSALAKAAPALSQGISSAASGAQKLDSGAQQVSSGASSLTEGAGKLVSGSSSAQDGAGELKNGLGSLESGASDLDKGLNDGVSQIPSYSDSEKDHLADVNASPVSLQQDRQNVMANYGTGLAPYFISLALWIGGIGFFMFTSPLTERLLNKAWPAPLVALRAWIPAGVMGLVQGGFVTLAVLFGLHLDVAHPWALWGLASLASLTFVTINQGLIAVLGSPGRFLSLIMVVLQVASAGGTYPPQTMPGFFQAVRQVLPMTYTVQAFRSLIAGGEPIGVGKAVLVLAIWLVAALLLITLGVFLSRRSLTVRDWATLAPGKANAGRPVDQVAAVSIPGRGGDSGHPAHAAASA